MKRIYLSLLENGYYTFNLTLCTCIQCREPKVKLWSPTEHHIEMAMAPSPTRH